LAPIMVRQVLAALRGLKGRLPMIVVEQNRTFLDELADYAGRDQSLVVYQHADRTRWGFVDARVPRLLAELAAGTGLDPVGAVVGHRGSTRAFAILATRDHCDVLAARLSSHARRWSSHTTLVDVAQRR